jgi:hypothetical protein
MSGPPSIGIECGNVCCAIICQDYRLYTQLSQQFKDFLSEESPDITIQIDVTDGESIDELNEVLPRITIKGEGDHFVADGLFLELDLKLSDRFIALKAERSFFSPEAEFKLINRLLTSAYYTACHWNHLEIPPAMLVHSSGLVRKGKAVLFTGPSGVGKTTVASLCGDGPGQVINDEMTLVTNPQSGDEEIMVRGAPIIGGLPQRANIEAPLKCVFSLRQSRQTMARRLSRVEAYLLFMRQIISPAFIGQTDKQELFSKIMEFSDEITCAIPFYELEFTLDQGALWRVLSEVEEELEKEEIGVG